MIPKINTIPILHLANGDILSIQVYQFSGTQPGKKAYIQSNLHGAEIVGNGVIYELINLLTKLDPTQLTGEIWLVPMCNPMSTIQRNHYFSTGRFNPYNGQDWNRIFWDYTKYNPNLIDLAKYHLNSDINTIRSKYLKLIQTKFQQELDRINLPQGVPLDVIYRYQLQSLCLDANYVLDLHSSSNQAIDYVYSFHTRENSAIALLFDYNILMTTCSGVSFEEAFIHPWLALERAYHQLGRSIKFDIEAWTLELGSGMVINPSSVNKAVTGITNYLAYHQMLQIEGYPKPETSSHQVTFIPKENIKRYYAPLGGMIQYRAPLGTIVKAQEVVYRLINYNREQSLPKIIEIKAETDGLVLDLSTNQGMNQGEYVITLVNWETL